MPYGLMNRIPYTLPDTILPTGTRCIQITIPDDDQWENDLYSLIAAEFGRWLMWERDIGKNGTKVASRWRNALKTWKHCDNSSSPIAGTLVELPDMSDLVQVICDDSGNCILQYRCDVCSPWITAANLGDISSGKSGAGNQPGAGGGKATYCVKLQANGTVIIPTPVGAGDTIQIKSYDGAGSDDGIGYFCGNGDTFFISCTGIGAATDSGDPVNTVDHMTFIINLAGTFHGLKPYGTPFVVPSGVSGVQPVIQVNDSVLSNNAGDYDICVEVTNNSVATFTHTFDFTTSPGGWVNASGPVPAGGNWIGGQGWSWTDFVFGGNHQRGLYINHPLASRTITAVNFTFNRTSGGTDSSGDDWLELFSNSTALGNVNYGTSDPSGTGLTHSSSTTSPTTTLLSLFLLSSNFNPATFAGSVLLTGMQVSGLGADPF